jgi:hypothetical protein
MAIAALNTWASVWLSLRAHSSNAALTPARTAAAATRAANGSAPSSMSCWATIASVSALLAAKEARSLGVEVS